LPQKLVISPGRQAVVKTLGPGGEPRTARFRVSALTIKRLRNGLSDQRFDVFEGSGPGNCADCWVYSIDYRGHSVSVAQTNVPIWLRKTIGRLEALVESHLPLH
jgi:hypothetical protein